MTEQFSLDTSSILYKTLLFMFFQTNRAFNSRDILQSLSINVILMFEPLYLLLQHHTTSLRLQILAGCLQEPPVGQIEGLADGQRDLFG